MNMRYMNPYRIFMLMLILIGMCGTTGCAFLNNLCPNFMRPADMTLKLPPKLSAQPTLSEVISVINMNNSAIHSFHAAKASVSVPNSPTLRANVAFERPMRLRLKGEIIMAGSVIDLGSNDEHFWFWAKPNKPPAIYYCRHDQYAGSTADQMLPIDPTFLIEAFGIGTIDPNGQHSGPYRRQDGRLEIRSVLDTAQGRVTKRTVIDPRQGWILEQHLFDQFNKHIVSSTTSDYRQDPLSGLWIARSIKINSPSTQFSMQMNLGTVRINQPVGNPGELWTMPQIEGAQIVNLGRPTQLNPSASQPPAPVAAPGSPTIYPEVAPTGEIPTQTPIMPTARPTIEVGYRQLPANSAVF